MSGDGAWEMRTAESKGQLKEVQCRVASGRDDVIVETCCLLRGSGQRLASSFKKKIYRVSHRCFKDSRVECRFCGHFGFSTHPAVLALTQVCEGREKNGECPETGCGKGHRWHGHVCLSSETLRLPTVWQEVPLFFWDLDFLLCEGKERLKTKGFKKKTKRKIKNQKYLLSIYTTYLHV